MDHISMGMREYDVAFARCLPGAEPDPSSYSQMNVRAMLRQR